MQPQPHAPPLKNLFLQCLRRTLHHAVLETCLVVEYCSLCTAVLKPGKASHAGRSLTKKKKRSVPVPRFPKNAHGHTMCWQLAVGS